MKKILACFVMIVFTLTSVGALADVDCPAATIKYIQSNDYNILIMLEGAPWRVLDDFRQLKQGGTMSEAASLASVQAKLSVALSAMLAGKRVVLRYPGNFDCTTPEYTTPSTSTMINIAN